MNKPHPQKIEDIIFRLDDFLTAMRGMENKTAVTFVQELDTYIQDWFADAPDELTLKKLSVALTDEMYLKISDLSKRDIHANGYFGIVVNRLFWELSQKGVLCFFILDNSLRDDRFKLTAELYKAAGFSVVHPYAVNDLTYSEKYTRQPTRTYKEIEKGIADAKSQKRHILYVEKDDGVNYLKNVLCLAEEFQDEYVCIFRNKAPSEHQTATWLMGSFAEMLK